MAVICLQQKQKRISSYAMLAQMVEVFTCFQLWQFKAVMVSWSFVGLSSSPFQISRSRMGIFCNQPPDYGVFFFEGGGGFFP